MKKKKLLYIIIIIILFIFCTERVEGGFTKGDNPYTILEVVEQKNNAKNKCEVYVKYVTDVTATIGWECNSDTFHVKNIEGWKVGASVNTFKENGFTKEIDYHDVDQLKPSTEYYITYTFNDKTEHSIKFKTKTKGTFDAKKLNNNCIVGEDFVFEDTIKFGTECDKAFLSKIDICDENNYCTYYGLDYNIEPYQIIKDIDSFFDNNEYNDSILSKSHIVHKLAPSTKYKIKVSYYNKDSIFKAKGIQTYEYNFETGSHYEKEQIIVNTAESKDKTITTTLADPKDNIRKYKTNENGIEFTLDTKNSSKKDAITFICNESNATGTTLHDLLTKYWSYVMIIMPLITVVLVMSDFIKAVLISDSDSIKKSSNNAFKRVFALVLLLMSPVILNTILGFFGFTFCF